ncbi:MAG: UPF0182 family protein [Deltaproteobacteria bacterium]|jgi:uncharacterized membrane protein (UPF0182 family)
MKRRTKLIVWIVVAGVIAFLILLAEVTGILEEWLWMKHVGYASIFWELLSIKWALFGIAFGCVLLCFWISLRAAANRAPATAAETERTGTPQGLTSFRSLLIAIVPAFIFALVYSPQWDTYLRFRWGGAFGEIDPVFHLDLGFYLFRLPFYQLIQGGITWLSFFLLLLTAGAYIYLGAVQVAEGGQKLYVRRRWPMIIHLSIIFLPFVFSLGWGFYLDRYELLTSSRGVVYGIGYTDDHVTLFTLWIMLFASPALGVYVLISLLARRFKTMLIGVGAYFVLYLVVISILPALVQKYKVEPSELELETPYLKTNIQLTRKAFNLDKITEKAYPSLMDLTSEDIPKNQETINNIRLWDYRPILETYRQTQEFRLYYQFYDVDVDRYHTEDGYHQVMLSARELAPELPVKARTWVNERLQFTHGYGLVMNFVSKKAPEGFPQYIIENIPPVSLYDLKVSRPDIYYGEKMPGYRIVATKVKELDYPKGNENVYTSYGGQGGVPVDTFWRRLLFAWTKGDINILLTGYLAPESRIQFWRRVQERVSHIAPFLKLDNDPYLVLSEGKLYWIQDAYTVSDRFPYSEPYGKFFQKLNYIRNSVKVVIDAYEGSVFFYIADPHDPVLGVYRKAFPGVFRELKELSEDLRIHLRYPQDLFDIQADTYRTYHMVDPQVFYNQEDLWAFPEEKYAGTSIRMVPYYILMRLPDTEELQYLLMTPFTPQSRDNMIAWMAAKCDFPEYGQLIVYQLPKERLTFGPIQVEAMIDQNTLISEQLSLWDQRGSRVIRGNLIVIPIEKSFLYVEPVYLIAEGTNIPQLKRVIVSSGSKVVMEPTLDESLKAVFGAIPEAEAVKVPARPQLEELTQARENMKKAEEAMKQGNWEDFGKAMEKLRNSLGPQPSK